MKWQPPQSVPDTFWSNHEILTAAVIVIAFFMLAATLSLAGHRSYQSTVPDSVQCLNSYGDC